MFSKIKMVKARKAVESMYDGLCTIVEHQKVKRENRSTGFDEVVTLEDQPCRMSFKSVNPTNQTNTMGVVTQSVTVYLSPDVEVKPGSKLTVTQNGVVTEYMCSGRPAVYSTHQEVSVELFKGWS